MMTNKEKNQEMFLDCVKLRDKIPPLPSELEKLLIPEEEKQPQPQGVDND